MLKRIIAVGAALILSGPFCFDRIIETDVGWHLALGRWIQSNGIPFRNALSWTAPNEPWYATSWLFDVIVARATNWFGVFGLQLTTSIFLALTLVGVAFAGERADRSGGVWVAPLVGLFLIPRITERPHVATWAVIAWVVYLCVPNEETRALRGSARDDVTWRRRLWCVPIIALGSNLHSGAAFAAIVLGFACLGEFWLGARRKREFVLAAAGVAALLANPGGFFNLAYVIEHLHVQDVIVLQEFLHPTFARHRPFFVLVPFAILFAWRVRREWPALLAIVLCFAAFGYRAVRVTYDFAIVSAPALAIGFAWIRSLHRLRFDVVFVLVAVSGLLFWQQRWLTNFQPAAEFNRDVLPVRAAEFIRTEKLDGRMFNGFRDGGYLEWAIPELLWFQDSRVQAWPPSFFARQQEAEKTPETFRAWLREWDCEWAIATRVNERLAGYHQLDAPDWALIYWDEASEIFVRRDVERLKPIVDRLEYRHFRPYGRIIGGVASASKAELSGWLGELDRFQSTAPNVPEAWLVRCAVQTRLGQFAEPACDVAARLDSSERGQKLLSAARSMSVAKE